MTTPPFDSKLTVDDFARLFGTTTARLPQASLDLIAKGNWRYRRFTGAERDEVLLEIIKRVDSGNLTLASPKHKDRWDKGWNENYEEFVQTSDLRSLVPKYIRPGRPLRLDQDYIATADPDFELRWYEVFRHWLFREYLAPYDNVYEFGCGTGFNLAAMAQIFPNKRYMGLDWAEASGKTVDHMSKVFGWNMRGRVFDFFAPDTSLEIAPNSAIVTIGALEQTNTNYHKLLEFFVRSKPKLVLHVEPIVEWYDESKLPDYLAARFHKIRNYWQGYPGEIAKLAAAGKAEILKEKRSYFGSEHIEGYSQLIWRPL